MNSPASSLSALLAEFPHRRVLVIGDVILDHYVHGSVSRTSPEAPVPILTVEEEEWLPGGAANVAKNIVTLGAKADLIGLTGVDDHAKVLQASLEKLPGLRTFLIGERKRPTIVKTRCVAQGQQMLRLDREIITPADDATCEKALKMIHARLKGCSGVILSDYGKGFLRPDLIEQIVKDVTARGLRVLVDPKGRDYARYRGISLLTPNQKEAAEATGIAITDDAAAERAAKELQKIVRAEAVVITRGAHGVSVFPKGAAAEHIPARAREVFDVTGAGDTFLSVLGLALFSGAKWGDAARLGNLAAGIVVGLAGVACVSPEALRAACDSTQSPQTKIVSAAELEQRCRSLRHNRRRVVFTNGFFDLLHHAHIRLLEEARAMGDCLIVALNSDDSTRRLKGAPRPILRERERAEMLAAFPFVDFVTVFSEDTPEPLLERLKPDLLVKGAPADGAEPEVVGREIVEGYGGKIKLVRLASDTSITSLITSISGLGVPPKAPAARHSSRRKTPPDGRVDSKKVSSQRALGEDDQATDALPAAKRKSAPVRKKKS
ncbi:bifunctional D-glycero-beta-D-manno-heptose-7-phosphate kinase/D-glycero-beta-D-manno-heptose 1-phosphate adenylyltransferase HldE [soil metagenome]